MIIQEDCLDYLKTLPDNSIDAIVTDPPYGLSFMGKKWDYDVPSVEIWGECLRILKPGGYLLAFAGTRTQHRMAVRIEDAGFEIRDMIAWVYGSGFPKSLNIGKAVDKRGGTTSDQSKEFAEYIKNKKNELNIPLSKADEVICGGTTNYSWFEGRPAGQRLPRKSDYLKMKELLQLDDRYDSFMEETEREVLGFHPTIQGSGSVFNVPFENGRPLLTKGKSEWEGWGTALKPALEPITVARKPIEGTVAENCLKHGVGGINIDGSRVETSDDISGLSSKTSIWGEGESKQVLSDGNEKGGRYPANLIHDGSEEVLELFPKNVKGEIGRAGRKSGGDYEASNYKMGVVTETGFKDSGSAARFFYCAKASKSERNMGLDGFEEKQTIGGGGLTAGLKEDGSYETASAGGKYGSIKAKQTNFHPTVKPIKLMEYLVNLVSKEGNTILDPFMGSGTTGMACKKLNRNFIGIELDPEYCEIAKARINAF